VYTSRDLGSKSVRFWAKPFCPSDVDRFPLPSRWTRYYYIRLL